MGDSTTRSIEHILVDSTIARGSHQWVGCVCDAHDNACNLQKSFTISELATTNLMAPMGNIVSFAGDPSSVAQDLSPIIHTEVTQALATAVAAPKGVHFIGVCLQRLS
jgi:hypothetical protein